MDGHPVRGAKPVQRWPAEHDAELRLFFLPAYSPDLNPDPTYVRRYFHAEPAQDAA